MKYQIIETMGRERSFLDATFFENEREVKERLEYMIDAEDDGKYYIEDNVFVYDLEKGKEVRNIFGYFEILY